MRTENKFLMASLFLALFVMASCGGDDPPPPAPVPIQPSEPTPTTTTYGGGCSAVPGGMPFRQDGSPYQGNLTSTDSYGVGTNSLQLHFSFMDHYTVDDAIHSVGANGMFNFPDLLRFLGGNVPGQTQQPFSFCVSSVDPMSSSMIPGVFATQDNSIAVVLRGMIQVPLYTYSPFDPYPGSNPYGNPYNQQYPQQQYQQYPQYPQIQGTTQEIVEVAIGNTPGCNAWLHQGRIVGCVQVRIGSGYNNYPLRYESR